MTTEATMTAAQQMPRRLQRPMTAVHSLEDSKAERLLLSRHHGEQTCRHSLAALYTLATQLRSPQLPYHAKQLITTTTAAAATSSSPSSSSSREQQQQQTVTLEQIWGQMSVLLRPVLRRLQDNVRQVQRTVATATARTAANSTSRAGKATRSATAVAKSGKKDEDEDADEDDSSTDESELDAEIATLLERRAQRRAAAAAAASGKQARKGSGNKDGDAATGGDWRYVFGKNNNKDGSGGADADDDDDADSWGEAADKDKDDEDGEDGGGNDEELQALRMMYGDDFADDGRGLAGEDDDPDLADDIELDDPANEHDEDEHGDTEAQQHAEAVGSYRPRDGQYYGKRDLLREQAADHDKDMTGDDDTGEGQTHSGGDVEQGDDDAELAAALRDPHLTPLERERLRERHLVARLEQARLYNTNWAMTGETAASKRPREALLEATELDYEYGMKAVPVITEAATAALEERIRRRIVDGHYDDVVRRVAATTPEDVAAAAARGRGRDAALDAEKSKLSLMDLYEKEYVERQRAAEEAAAAGHEGGGAAAAEPLTEIEKDELRAIQLWRRLAQHLDALSNFFYTPKPVQHDLDARVRAVDRQAPAIALETVGHSATSRESALAPQDLYRGSSHAYADVGAAEMTPQERRALRRAKKQSSRQHTHAVQVVKQRKQQQQQQQQGTGAKTTAKQDKRVKA